MAKICFSPSESRSLDRACPASLKSVMANVDGIDVDPLDHRLLAQQVAERLGDQVGEPIDLALGRPRQELLHHDPRLGGDPGHPLAVVLGELVLRLPLADRLELRARRASQLRLALGHRAVQLLRLLVERRPAARSPRGAARGTRRSPRPPA